MRERERGGGGAREKGEGEREIRFIMCYTTKQQDLPRPYGQDNRFISGLTVGYVLSVGLPLSGTVPLCC